MFFHFSSYFNFEKDIHEILDIKHREKNFSQSIPSIFTPPPPTLKGALKNLIFKYLLCFREKQIHKSAKGLQARISKNDFLVFSNLARARGKECLKNLIFN